jgi:hypothetical protein
MAIKRTNTDGAQSGTSTEPKHDAASEAQSFRENADVNAKIDAYIEKNPKQRCRKQAVFLTIFARADNAAFVSHAFSQRPFGGRYFVLDSWGDCRFAGQFHYLLSRDLAGFFTPPISSNSGCFIM